MKKTAIIALAALLTLGMIIPAIATDLEVSGHFRARGFLMSNTNTALSEDGKGDAFYDFRFRPVLKFNVNENLSITSRVVVFNEKFGTDGGNDARYTENTSDGKSDVAQWEYAWATWKTPYGILDAGRMKGGLFGLSLFETEVARDRIKWTTKIGDLALLGIIEKNREDSNSSVGDNDSEAYYLAGVYKVEDTEIGCLLGQIRDEEQDDNANAKGTTSYMLVNPYFDIAGLGDGNLSVKGEIQNRFGKKSQKATSAGEDIDISAMGFYLAAGYDFGQFDLELGYANTGGDDESVLSDNEISSLGGLGVVRAGLGDEWVPLVVLQDINGLLDQGTNSTYKTSTGVSLMYLQGNFAVNDDVTLTAIIGQANPAAERVDATGNAVSGSDESFGTEFDLKLAWNLPNDLKYFFNFGYLMAGDFFKELNGGDDPENTYTIYHGIEFDF
jgi:hypothetical protein